MTSDQEQLLSAFKNKVLRLKRKHETLIREHGALQEEHENIKRRNATLEDEISRLHDQLNMLKMAGTIVSGSSGLGELKETVSRMMLEIDECIKLMND